MFFINMQAHYDAEIARGHHAIQLASIEPVAGVVSTVHKWV